MSGSKSTMTSLHDPLKPPNLRLRTVRDKRYPVDGGVFDVPANAGEVVIPIRASLMVRKPAAFAVTVEKPGGVVVSGREHVVALGAIGEPLKPA